MSEDVTIQFNKSRTHAQLPFYSNPGDAGFDILACLYDEQPMKILPGETGKIPTGLISEIPKGWLVSIRPRSGLAANHSLTIQNAPGTIDSGYRGEWYILLRNEGVKTYFVHHGARIAQGLLEKSYKAHFDWSPSLTKTVRGRGGFGSTGL
jgi:dUTP pyrophosphatase